MEKKRGMKVEVIVERERLVIDVDGFVLDVSEELGSESVEHAIKKSVWLYGVAYEIERRYNRFVGVEKKAFMGFWREWAIKWLRAKGMPDTMDLIDSTVARMFGEEKRDRMDMKVNEKIGYLYDIARVFQGKRKSYSSLKEFLRDDEVSDNLKDLCREMYKLELEENMTYDRVIDTEARMFCLVRSLKTAAEGYGRIGSGEKSLRF